MRWLQIEEAALKALAEGHKLLVPLGPRGGGKRTALGDRRTANIMVRCGLLSIPSLQVWMFCMDPSWHVASARLSVGANAMPTCCSVDGTCAAHSFGVHLPRYNSLEDWFRMWSSEVACLHAC